MQPLFIVFEGIDGSGTSTQAAKLQEYFESKKIPSILTSEPSTGPVGSLIRTEFLSGKKTINNPLLWCKLFATDRAEHLDTTVLPALKENKIVICDRYFVSNLAYQGLHLPFEEVWEENRKFLKPDLLIYLKVLPEQVDEVFQRIQKRDSQKEVFEKITTQKTISENYDRVFSEIDYKTFTKRVLSLNALESIQDIHKSIIKVIGSILTNENFV